MNSKTRSTQPRPVRERIDLDKVDWFAVLPAYGIHEDYLKGKLGSCPLPNCGGKTRFKFYKNASNGRWFCVHCGTGNGLSLLQQYTGKEWGTLCYEIRTGNYNGGMPVFQPAPPPKEAKGRDDQSDEDKRRALQYAWDHRAPEVTEDSPVWQYISGRVPGLKREWLSPDVAYHPGMTFVDHTGKKLGKYPVMLLRARRSDRTPVTLHRTFLTKEGEKVPFVDEQGDSAAKKQMSSPYPLAGASIKLNTAVSRKLDLVEGSETGFARVAACENRREVRSLLNARNLGDADLDWDQYDEIDIYADRDRLLPDKGYRTGQHFAEKIKQKAESQGKRCRIIYAVTEGEDFNDVWKKQYAKREARKAAREAKKKARDEARAQHAELRQAA
ncbi:primase-helicase zinc-binding domain-containing protein [Burkholderia sp. Ac-20365]|uniref:DUF7146 domain-containing protein n=1 Tax=Burkholderia sp. Ac-20365 TaxID=2703897 RepID=UPI00197B1244|nr:primase-helicase zinc-binding domain-containing protein [Burkholderia sp. Ac-20365]MBN3760981.1 hypothetical protein [Burkholderia sp. Ac-20365]